MYEPPEWLHHLAGCGQCKGYARGDQNRRCERGEFLYREYRGIMELRRPKIPHSKEEWLGGGDPVGR